MMEKATCAPDLNIPSFAHRQGYFYQCTKCRRRQTLAGFKVVPCRSRAKGSIAIAAWLKEVKGDVAAKKRTKAVAAGGAK